MVRLIPIYIGDSPEVKIEIYYQIMGVITKVTFKSIFLWIVVQLETLLEKVIVEGILMMCIDRKVQQCHSIIAGINVNNKEQVMITDIKLEMKFSIYQVLPEEPENLCKT